MELAGDAACDLGNFKRVRQPRTEQVAFMVYEHLGLVFQPAKGCRMNNAIAVTLKLVAVDRLVFGVNASP